MLFKLMCLYQNGIALGMEDLLMLPRHTGHLVIEDWARCSRFSAFSWQARLLDMSIKEAPRDIVPPLYNPRPVKMPDMQDRQMTLHGYERQVDGNRVVAHVQYWVLLPLAAKEDVVEQKAQ